MDENQQWDNVYFGGLLVSKNLKHDAHRATEGLMHEGELPHEIEANGGREKITILQGTLHYKPRESEEWTVFKIGSTFIIPSGTFFLWKVIGGDMQYRCVYLDSVVG